MDHKTPQDSRQFWEPHEGPMTFVMITTPTKPMTRYNHVAGFFPSEYEICVKDTGTIEVSQKKG